MAQTTLLARRPLQSVDRRERILDHNQMRWRVTGGYEWLLHGPDAPNWSRLASCHTAELVKRNSKREVWKVGLRDQLFFAKVYFAGGWRGRLKQRLRGPAGELEWRHACFALEHDIPAVIPVACGHPTLPGDPLAGVLVTQALEDALPLDECWRHLQELDDPAEEFRAIRRVSDALARAIARAHQARFEHFDMHVGNVLVQGADTQDPQVAFADLHTVHLGRPLTEKVVVRNLAQLNQWFRRHANGPSRLRFLKRYLHWRAQFAHRPVLGMNLRRLAAAMDEAARRHARWLGAKRDRRAMRSGKYFTRVRFAGGWKGQAFLQSKHPRPLSRASALRFTAEEWEQWLANPSRWLASHARDNVIKESSRTRVMHASLPVENQALDVFVKASRPAQWYRRILSHVRASRDQTAWRTAYALLHRDLPTPHPLVFLERRTLGLLRESMILVEALPDAKDLDRFALDSLPAMDPAEAHRVRAAVTEAVVRLIRRMETHGFDHRDLKASNVLIRAPQGADEPVRAWLIDVDGISLRRRLSRRRRLAPVMRLNVSFDPVPAITLTDRLRFLKRYLLATARTDADWKELWRELAEWSSRKRRRKRRREERKMQRYRQS